MPDSIDISPEEQAPDIIEISPEEQSSLGIELGRSFSPAAPIDKKALFSGRTDQLRRMIDAIGQRGQHVIVFGEQGVGKTSLANVLSDFLQGQKVLAISVNCDNTDNYSKLWRKIISEIQLTLETRQSGYTPEPAISVKNVAEDLPDEITPGVVEKVLRIVGGQDLLIVIIDKFDRLPNSDVSRLFADTIKTLSDHSVPATLVVVGVADTVDRLIAEHQSAEHALVQICMPRMSRDELEKIIDNGLSRVNMKIDHDAKQSIIFLSQGLPHYTHLLGLHAGREAIDNGSTRITQDHVGAAIRKALRGAQQTIITDYHKATMSSRKNNIYAQVLVACVLAESDELGYFAAADVRGPLSTIMNKNYDIPLFSRHLSDFCQSTRGPILQKTGYKYRYRYRFSNPILQPFVLMQGLDSGMITITVEDETDFG